MKQANLPKGQVSKYMEDHPVSVDVQKFHVD